MISIYFTLMNQNPLPFVLNFFFLLTFSTSEIKRKDNNNIIGNSCDTSGNPLYQTLILFNSFNVIFF